MNRSKWTVLVAAYALLGAACGPGADVESAGGQYLIYNYDPATGEYGLERARIDTLRDVRTVDGDVVYLLGGGELISTDTEPTTEEEWEDALVVERAGRPTVEFTVDSDGTVLPWDFDSAMMLTVYHHMERSSEYFDTVDVSALDLGDPRISRLVGRVPVYYYPQVSLFGFPLPVFTDNAAYAFTMNAFLVPPRVALTDAVPIYANRGVITHEYAHAVFNRLVYDNARVPAPILNADEWPALPANELSGLDEGVADMFAFLDVKDPNFIAPSSKSILGRDMSEKKRYPQLLLELAQWEEGDDPITDEDGNVLVYGPHDLGAVCAAVFYEMREIVKDEVSDDELGRILATALVSIRNPTPDFRITQFFDALHDNLPASKRAEVCSMFKERLEAVEDLLTCSP